VIASMRAPSPAQLPTVQPAQPVAAATVTSDPPPSLAGPDPVVPTAQVAPLQPIEQPTVAPLAEMSAATLDPDAALLDARATEPVVIAAMPARPVAQAIERGDVASPSAALPQEAAPPPISPAPTIESREPSAAASPSLSSLTTAHPPLAALAIGLDTSGLSSVSAPVEVTPEPANDAVASALGALAAGLAASARPAAPVRAEIVVPAPPAIATPAVPDLVGDSQSSSAPTDQSVAVLASTVPSAEVAALAASVGFEDKAAGLLRPMLRQWLDDNMPRIVEKALLIELSESGLLEMALASRDEASKD
jgi:cell pole-organizing protein PopZ